jgi:hypothetical protein
MITRGLCVALHVVYPLARCRCYDARCVHSVVCVWVGVLVLMCALPRCVCCRGRTLQFHTPTISRFVPPSQLPCATSIMVAHVTRFFISPHAPVLLAVLPHHVYFCVRTPSLLSPGCICRALSHSPYLFCSAYLSTHEDDATRNTKPHTRTQAGRRTPPNISMNTCSRLGQQTK